MQESKCGTTRNPRFEVAEFDQRCRALGLTSMRPVERIAYPTPGFPAIDYKEAEWTSV